MLHQCAEGLGHCSEQVYVKKVNVDWFNYTFPNEWKIRFLSLTGDYGDK
jgi:hypothetical protein